MAKAMIITFADGDIQSIKGDRFNVDDGVLTVGFKAGPGSYGQLFADEQWTGFPLANIKSYHWGNV